MDGKYRVFLLKLDGVVYDFPGGLLQYLRDRWGIRKPLDTWENFHLARMTDDEQINRDIIAKIQDPFWYDEFVRPYPWSEEALHLLQRWGKLAFVSARPPGSLRNQTRRSLAGDFGSDIFDVDTMFSMTKNRVKAAVQFHANYAFDDNAKVAVEYHKNRVACYVVDQPYNRNKYIPNWWLRPAGNLLEAAKAFERSMQAVEV